MRKFFFALSGLHFSRLCIFFKIECHRIVNTFLRDFQSKKLPDSNQFFYHIFTAF